MKILTWNVYRHNREIQQLFSKAKALEPDVACFQEVREEHMPLLQSVFAGYSLCKARQFFLKKDHSASILLYNTTLTKLPVDSCSSIAHDWSGYSLPPRYRRDYEKLDLHFPVLDLRLADGKAARVFNLHLECVAPPSLRMARLKQVQESFRPDAINIIAGDFNSFLNPLFSLFVAPLYGNFKLADFLCNERTLVAQTIRMLKLGNPFAGTSTFRYYPGQYDYILVPTGLGLEPKHKERISGLSGSDHYGLLLEF